MTQIRTCWKHNCSLRQSEVNSEYFMDRDTSVSSFILYTVDLIMPPTLLQCLVSLFNDGLWTN